MASVQRIVFDEKFKTFSLYAGNSLYAFCISPELSLEHLYWGKNLDSGYDLRYLSQSSRMTVFETSQEIDDDGLNLSTMISKVDLDNFDSQTSMRWTLLNDAEAREKIRYDNLKWRVNNLKKMNKESMELAVNLEARVNELIVTDVETSVKELDTTKSDDAMLFRDFQDGGRGGSPLLSVRSTEETSVPTRPRRTSSPEKRQWSDSQFAKLPPMSDSLDLRSSDLMSMKNYVLDETLGTKEMIQQTQSLVWDRKSGGLGKSILCLEYSDHGSGDFRSPSFVVVATNGSSILPLRYKSHKILNGKPDLPDYLPGIRCANDSQATTLIVTASDENSGLEVDLYYVCLHFYDAIVRRTVFRNSVGGPKVIQKAMSSTVDFESSHASFHLVQLSGSWARERMMVETKLTHGMQSFGSSRGVSSHQHNPFAILTCGPPSENEGEVKAFSLIYSGNFTMEAELSEMGRLRFNVGVNPMGFAWNLNPGESFNSPEVLLVRSAEGMGGVSRVMHRVILDCLIPLSWSNTTPPIILNSWEAKYFNVDHNSILEMAMQAIKINADMLVMDDGWFGVRDDITSSLGDWRANPKKFPMGLDKLAMEVNSLGLKFGIWIEPEMVSVQSELYKAHSDWVLTVPGLVRQVGRSQLVLDLSRRCVRDYLYNELHNLFSSANISYVKWDMNRPLTEVFSKQGKYSDGSEGVWQAETSHRYVLGVYELMTRLRGAFPQILFEHCASGGGRFDLGMLYFSPQIWCSDNTDALVRLKIQYGTSLAYPARCVGAHVSDVPNHITGNTTRAKTRAFVAMCGTFGFELDLTVTPSKEILLYRDYTYIYLSIHHIIRFGDLYRLWNPFQVNFASWMYVSRDKTEAVVFCFSLNSEHWSKLVPRLQLRGLQHASKYEVTEPLPNNLAQQTGNLKIVETEFASYQLRYSSTTLTGLHLMEAGLPVKFYTLDDSVMFILKKVGI